MKNQLPSCDICGLPWPASEVPAPWGGRAHEEGSGKDPAFCSLYPHSHSVHSLHGLSSASESLCPSHRDRVTRDKPLASLRATPPSLRTSAKALLPNELPLVAVAVGFLPHLFWGTSQHKAPVPMLPSCELVTPCGPTRPARPPLLRLLPSAAATQHS